MDGIMDDVKYMKDTLTAIERDICKKNLSV